MENTITPEDLQEEKQGNLESFARIADKLIDGLFNYAQMSGEDFEKYKKAYSNEITDLQTVITEINNNLKK
mgnify:CR=1 FL=1